MKNTKTTDKGMSKYKISIGIFLKPQASADVLRDGTERSASAAERRKALSTTIKELMAIPKPAPHAGNHPIRAKGTQAAL